MTTKKIKLYTVEAMGITGFCLLSRGLWMYDPTIFYVVIGILLMTLAMIKGR